MNSRRKFLQITSLLSASSIIAKPSMAVENSIRFLEDKIFNKSIRSVHVMHTGRKGLNTILKDKIMVHPEILTNAFDETHQDFTVKTIQKGLIKTGVLRYDLPNGSEKEITNQFIAKFCAAAEDLRKNQNCQMIVAYLNTPMPDRTKIVNKDFWVAQLHSIDLLFVQEEKEKNFSRICQGKNKQEIIISPLHNKQKDFGSITLHFDLESKKKAVEIA